MLKIKRGAVSLVTIQSFLLITSIIAISFILSSENVRADVPAVSVVPTQTPYVPLPKQTYFALDFGDGKTTVVQWLGTENGIARGETALGEVKSWEAIGDDTIKPADITPQIISNPTVTSNWGKTFTLNGNTYAVSDAAANPFSIPGLTGSGGELTEVGKNALSDAGIKNAIIQNGQVLAGGSSYSYSPFGIFTTNNFLVGNLLEGLSWSIAVVGVIQLVGPLLGAKPELTNALSAAAFAGIMSGKLALGLFGQATPGVAGSGGVFDTFLTGTHAGLIGVVVAVVVFALLYKKESKKVVELRCLPWEAPLGGADCEKCNTDPLKPCSEYRCKSLGQACELVNKGSVEERCTWVSRNDVNSPTITPWTKVLTEGHKYTDMQGRPPSRGTRVVRNDASDGCIKPFTPLQFGIVLNEPSQCKIDSFGNKSFDAMQYYFGESNFYRYNHTEQLRLPSPGSVNAESPDVPNDGIYNFYVRCRDANGNVNEDEFVFNICVDKSPDTTPPIIDSTSIVSGSPITFGTQSINVTAYVNEPSECRWSIQDKTYDLMENNMSCSTHVYEQNARQLYPCNTMLNGIKDHEDNAFFFRCKDQPLKPANERNVNQESYRFSLKGTQMLNILSVGPNGTFTGSTDVIAVNLTVKTDDGAEEGKAICSFSPSGQEGTFIPMFETNSYQHKQILTLVSGNYTYYFRCVDDGGNAATGNTTFNVFVDRAAPQITRAYKEGPDALKVVTDEASSCMYSITNCNFVFNEGVRMLLLNARERTTHAAQWKTSQTYYIKCKDDYGNEPSPNACSVIASASTVI